MNKMYIVITTIIFIFIILTVSWYFYYSIYEVKFIYSFNPQELEIKQTYSVQCVGYNALGHEINFRDLKFSALINEGKNILEVKMVHANTYQFVFIDSGQASILLNSKYALNPTLLTISAKDKL